MDTWGRALLDYHQGKRDQPLYLHTSYGPPEQVPLQEFLKYDLRFTSLEEYALDICRGRILDVGAGTGAHTLILQEQNQTVTALEISAGACEVMRDRGVHKVEHGDYRKFKEGPFDTLLLMMNGAGLAGTLSNLGTFLNDLKSLLSPGGQIVMDSCDIQYLFETAEVARSLEYYGNLNYCYHYQGVAGASFPWLFTDPFNLIEIAESQGLETQIVFQEGYQYLARLTAS